MNNKFKELDDFYDEKMDRSPSRYKLLEIIRDYFKGRTSLVGAEIGVFKGAFSKKINEYISFDMFHLIDIWDINFPYDGGETPRKLKTDGYMTHIYEEVVKEFGGKEKYNIVKQPSNVAVNNFADKYLDFIYIDGNHQTCDEDLRLWYPKLKPGGIIAGHDYYGKVKTDVDEFFSKKVYVVKSNIPQWIYCSSLDFGRIFKPNTNTMYKFSQGNIGRLKQINRV